MAVLAQFYLGPQDQIEPIYLDFHFWRTDLMWAAFIATLLLAIFMGTIWLVRRQLHEYGWIALAFFAYLLFLSSFIRDSAPTNNDLYSWTFLLGRSVFLLSFMLFIHRFLNMNRLILERSMIIFYVLLYSAGLFLISIGHFLWFRSAILSLVAPIELILLGYFAFVTLNALRQNNTSYLHWFFSGSLLGFTLGIHDLLVVLSIKHWLIQDFYISQYAVIFVVLGYGGVMVHRVARALLNSEELNEELSLQLALKTEDLKREAELRIAHQKELALAEERQRILADMHDGVGGQLTTLLAASRQRHKKSQADQNHFTVELEQIIADLRLVLDTMSPAGEELIATLARLRERYQPLFRQVGINLIWSIDHQIEELPLPPSQVINVLRFVQEALQNVVKHAQADQTEFRLVIQENQVLITINDNGRGSNQENTGYGLQTMKLRAQKLAGTFTTRKISPSGLSVRLQFPIPK